MVCIRTTRRRRRAPKSRAFTACARRAVKSSRALLAIARSLDTRKTMALLRPLVLLLALPLASAASLEECTTNCQPTTDAMAQCNQPVLRPGLLLRRHDVRVFARLLSCNHGCRIAWFARTSPSARRTARRATPAAARTTGPSRRARSTSATCQERRLDQPRRVRGGLRQRFRGERSGPRPRDDLLQRPEVHEPAVAAAAPEERLHRADGHERELRREHRGHRLLVGVGGLRRRAVRVRAGGRQLARERPRPALRRRRIVAARSDRALRRRPRRRRRRGRHPVHALVPLDLPGRARGARRDRGVHQLRLGADRSQAVGHPVGVAARQDIEPPPRRPHADVAPRL